MVKQWQDKFFNQRFSHSVFNDQPDFIKLSEAYRVKSYLIEDPNRLEEQLDEAFQHDGPAMIEVRISLSNLYTQWFLAVKPMMKWRVYYETHI